LTHWKFETVCTAYNGAQLPASDLPEVAFLGRSNVGKSTLINALLDRLNKKIAYVSSKPGKTRSANFYRIETPSGETFCLVDMPGYGYAAGGAREQWRALLNGFFGSGRNISFAVHLIDFRHGPLAGDDDLTAWLDGFDMPRLVVFTKGDKVPKGRAKSFYEKYAARGLSSILPPVVTRGKNDEAAERLRGDIPRIISELNK
jgi:GTP-binding protein